MDYCNWNILSIVVFVNKRRLSTERIILKSTQSVSQALAYNEWHLFVNVVHTNAYVPCKIHLKCK